MGILAYFIGYQQILTYLTILMICFILSVYKDKDHSQSISLALICVSYVTAPLLRGYLQDLGVFNVDRGFFEFYTYYNMSLAILLAFINYGDKRATPLYILYMTSATINWWCFSQWNCNIDTVPQGSPVKCYTTFIYENYQFVNRVLMDNVVLAAVAIKKKKRLILVSGFLLVTPYLIQ